MVRVLLATSQTTRPKAYISAALNDSKLDLFSVSSNTWNDTLLRIEDFPKDHMPTNLWSHVAPCSYSGVGGDVDFVCFTVKPDRGNHAGLADLIICLSGRFDLMKCMSVRYYLTARPKSAMAQLPSRLTRMFFVLMSLKNIMIWVYLVLMLLQIHRTLLQKTIILTKRPISMTDVLSLSA